MASRVHRLRRLAVGNSSTPYYVARVVSRRSGKVCSKFHYGMKSSRLIVPIGFGEPRQYDRANSWKKVERNNWRVKSERTLIEAF